APITQSFILLPGTYHTIARSTQAGFKPDFVQTTVKFGNDHFDGPSIVCKNIVIADFTYERTDLLSGHTMSVDPVHLNASEYALPGSWCHSNVGFNTSGGATDYGTPNLLNPHCPAGTF
ncbi:MAG TPA: hypothetical protein VMU50_10775, partial [Polyangia bacterium]|nr:hypothetical protein [Polyangia bacterium]